jgi:hypothetical protein
MRNNGYTAGRSRDPERGDLNDSYVRKKFLLSIRNGEFIRHFMPR